ncbi:hypothetical protein ACN47E_010351 [Coniothyrium glycines]
MDGDEDLDIATAMGFASFGGTKKRKYDQASSPKIKPDASGANSTKLGMRTKKATRPEDPTPKNAYTDENQTGEYLQSEPAEPSNKTTPLEVSSARPRHLDSSVQSTEMLSFGGSPISRAELNALKFGVKNEHGDRAYFLPSFVEDPWEKLTVAR